MDAKSKEADACKKETTMNSYIYLKHNLVSQNFHIKLDFKPKKALISFLFSIFTSGWTSIHIKLNVKKTKKYINSL